MKDYQFEFEIGYVFLSLDFLLLVFKLFDSYGVNVIQVYLCFKFKFRLFSYLESLFIEFCSILKY